MTLTTLFTTFVHRLQRFDEAVTAALGTDMRMIYGFGVPIVLMGVLISLMSVSASTWVVVAAMVLEVLALCVVTAGFIGVLDEEPDDA